MADEGIAHKLDQLPPEMIEFTLLKTTGALAPRLGRISLAGRRTVLTPGFIANTSRGVVPHVSPDNFRKSVDVSGVYIPLEDCSYQPRDQVPHLLIHIYSRREAPAASTPRLQV